MAGDWLRESVDRYAAEARAADRRGTIGGESAAEPEGPADLAPGFRGSLTPAAIDMDEEIRRAAFGERSRRLIGGP
jgi:hypothetical protein